MADFPVADIFDARVSFEERALRVFRFQYQHNVVYARFCNALGFVPGNVTRIDQIPLLPVKAFKEQPVKTGEWKEETFFSSSGTSRMKRSRHFIRYTDLYRRSLLDGFTYFYGSPDQWTLLVYTPGYAENLHSSLVWMLHKLIEASDNTYSGFLPIGKSLDQKRIDKAAASGRRIMLFGAAFGLADLAEQSQVTLPDTSVIIETGGMKTYRRELAREELHQILAENFSVNLEQVHSEYGMTELLSQAYDTGDGLFRPPPWMEIVIYDPDDPATPCDTGTEGLIGIIDLANVYSCSFLVTGDVGVQNGDGSFKVLGRWEKANLRGCNFLLEEDR